jgi:protein-S-isoprenylcysteine O-methyltransferase Ste14
MTKQYKEGVKTPPPIVYLSCILIGIGINNIWSAELLPQSVQYSLGPIIIIVSFILFGMVLREFMRSTTSINHAKLTTEILTSGPFAYSRNPVYVSMTLLSFGIAITLDNMWIIIMLIPGLFVIYYFVIRKEEHYLELKFGSDYIQYKNSVRRWF